MCLVGKVSLCVSTWDSSLSLRDLYCRSDAKSESGGMKKSANGTLCFKINSSTQREPTKDNMNMFELSRYSLECLFLWHLLSEATKLVSLACLKDSGGFRKLFFLVQLSDKQNSIRHSQPVPSNVQKECSIVLGLHHGP